MSRKIQLGRTGQNAGRIQVGATTRFAPKERVLDTGEPDEWFRVLLPMPEVVLTSGDSEEAISQPQDYFQVEWLCIPPALRIIAGSAVATSSFPAVQVDDSNDFTLEAIIVGTTPQVLRTGSMPIAAFAPDSMMPDLVLDGGPTSKEFRLDFTNNGTQSHTLRPIAVALKAV